MSEDVKKLTATFGSFPTLLTIAFIVLKLCNVINWSWVWVLSPIWIPFGFGIIILLIVLIVVVLGVNWMKKNF